MKTYDRVWAEVDLDAIYHNVAAAKALTRPGTRLMAVIKADGYGHGAVPLAEVLDPLADAYGVAIVEEGIELRQAGVTKPILILGYTPESLYEPMLDYDITATVYTREMASSLSETALHRGKRAKVHIKLDTGMSRIGFLPDQKSLHEIQQIAAMPGIEIDGCFTHFARMDERDKGRAEEQFRRYMDFTEQIEAAGIPLPVKHVSNSAGIIEMPEVNLDMVRDGICIYGLYPSEEVSKDLLPLIPAMQWKARVSHVKTLPAGVEIGYGGTYTTQGETKVATIPLGYADGYPRSLSNRGSVLIHGQRAAILGRVCMDQFMVDVTEIPDVQTGSLVTLFGRDGDVVLPVEEVADLSGSFNYEFVCDVGRRVPRVYYRHGKIIGARDCYPDF
ncbi:MAG: alanine racemase [Lachnospiraceae bacterium]|nr:alanine racemase [Lachnospiraceae bacterium]